MAGIGFELRRLYQDKGILPGLKASLFSTLITAGPTLLCILMLTTVQYVLHVRGANTQQRELFMAVVVYSFLFSMILTSGFTMLLSRYISDRLYVRHLEDILPSLKGGVTLCMPLCAFAGTAFYARSQLALPVKLAAYILFMELCLLWLLTVYISALKDYMRLVTGFCLEAVATAALSYILVEKLKVDPVLGVLTAIDSGFLILVVFFAHSIQSFFPSEKSCSFSLLRYFDKYPSLFLINLFYTLGQYVHNFVFWKSRHQVVSSGTYVFSTLYDVPAFWAFLSVIPAMVTFVVSCETSLYEAIRAFYNTIFAGGTLPEIRQAKNEMCRVLGQNLKQVMTLQLFFTFLSLVLGMVLLPLAGITGIAASIFRILVIGDYAFILLFILLSILLYYDDRKGALWASFLFLTANTLLSEVSLHLGENYYGLGFMTAAFMSLGFSFIRLRYVLLNLDYFTFCSQPLVYREKERLFTKLSQWLDGTLPEKR